MLVRVFSFFFFNDTATTEIYTLSLHDALPIFDECLDVPLTATTTHQPSGRGNTLPFGFAARSPGGAVSDRKSTRLNSSHSQISYAVFCLKKKNNKRGQSCLPPSRILPVRRHNL